MNLGGEKKPGGETTKRRAFRAIPTIEDPFLEKSASKGSGRCLGGVSNPIHGECEVESGEGDLGDEEDLGDGVEDPFLGVGRQAKW